MKKEHYKCVRCNYTTPQKSHMRQHFTNIKPCPALLNVIELTPDIKKFILDNRIYNIPTPMQTDIKNLQQSKEPPDIKKSVKETGDTGMIYLIREREFLKLNETVIKIGRSKNISTRLGQYPKGSTLMFVTPCKNEIEVEKELIEIFKSRFEQRKDIGTEYFCGDVIEMSNCISVHISKINQSCE